MKDQVLIAVAANERIRAYAASTKELTEEARQRHHTLPTATAALGRTLTAAAMMGAMMKGERDTVSLKLHGNGPIGGVQAVADSHGHVKGYVQNPQVLLPPNDKGKLDVSGALGVGVLSVTRDLGLKEPVTGTCILVSGEIAEDLTYYFATSEQTPSSVALGVLVERDGTVKEAGGFIVQLLPDATDELAAELEERIGELNSVTSMLRAEMTPEDILQHVLRSFDMKVLERREVSFQCGCSREKLLDAIATLPREDLEKFVADDQGVEATCDYCGDRYTYETPEIAKLLEK